MSISNPFVTFGYVSSKYFCDRTGETAKIIDAVKNERNLTLYSLRRIGKTGLLKHVFRKLEREKNIECFYFDLSSTSNLSELINVLGDGIIGKFDSSGKRFFSKVTEIFSNLRPQISIDPLTGQPSLQLSIENGNEAIHSLKHILEYIDSIGKKVILAFDEFQQIIHYPESNIEEIFRTHIQQTKNITYIFSGSSKHLVLSMFSEKKRPFYQSTELLHLDKIDRLKYLKFIKKMFSENGKKIADKNVEYILNWTEIHTFYVQYVCNKIFAKTSGYVTDDLIRETLLEILNENNDNFLQLKSLLPKNQWYLLKAIAKENGIKQITSQRFIAKHRLPSASSLAIALKALQNKELVTLIDNKYKLENVFLQRWLERE